MSFDGNLKAFPLFVNITMRWSRRVMWKPIPLNSNSLSVTTG